MVISTLTVNNIHSIDAFLIIITITVLFFYLYPETFPRFFRYNLFLLQIPLEVNTFLGRNTRKMCFTLITSCFVFHILSQKPLFLK